MATLQDIAQEANVSASAVSMVINNRVGISPQTRERVKEAMRKLQYRRVGGGRPLKGGQVYNLAIIYDSWFVRDGHVIPMGAAWINSIHQTAVAAGHNVSVFVGAHYETDQVFQRFLANSEFQGAILMGAGTENAHYKALAAHGVPVVIINRRPKYDEFSYVAIDNYGGGRLVAEYLYDLGHRRIAHLRDPLQQSFRVDRIDGFNDAMAERGLKAVCTSVVEIEALPEAIASTCQLVADAGATAVFMNASVSTVSYLDAWMRMGISIPRQLSVIDFDNRDVRSEAGLRPSSVGFDNELMGASAMELLLKLLESGNEIRRRSMVVSTHIAEHDTTAAVAK